VKYFEDVRVGDTAVLGARTVTEEEILRFGRAYDPQPFHTDPDAAARSLFGGLIASGWHTCAIMMRLSVDAMQRDGLAGMGSPGIDSCRWLKPVRAGDTLTLTREILETWPSRTRPFGFVRSKSEMTNQAGDTVLTIVGVTMIARRPEAAR
jgi:acyl dehydratase